MTPDGRHVVTASHDKTARVWKLTDDDTGDACRAGGEEGGGEEGGGKEGGGEKRSSEHDEESGDENEHEEAMRPARTQPRERHSARAGDESPAAAGMASGDAGATYAAPGGYAGREEAAGEASSAPAALNWPGRKRARGCAAMELLRAARRSEDEQREDEPLRPLNEYSFVPRFCGDTGMCLNMLNSRTSRGVHTHALTSATVSPDGEHIVTASEDCTACVWRLSDSYSPSVWLRRLGVSFAGVGGSPPGGGGPVSLPLYS